MIRTLTLSGLVATAILAGGCDTVFEPIQPEVSTPIGRMDRAEAERQRAPRTHPECLIESRGGSREEQARRRERCDRMERGL